MKKRVRKIISLLLALSIIATAFVGFSAGATELTEMKNISLEHPFERFEDENGIRYFGATGNAHVNSDNSLSGASADDYKTQATAIKCNKVELAATSALPALVDNSDTRFFPEIGNQGQIGSCQYWAQVYYQFTYEMNRSLGVTTVADNTFSPQWAYNIVASTDDLIGTYYDVYTMMRVQGNVFQSQVPYTEDKRSFSPTEDIWKTSIKYRLKDYKKFEDVGEEDSRITSPDDTDLTEIKTALANGKVLTFSSYIYSWDITKLKQNKDAPENSKYANEEVLREVDGSNGSHRLTIVGYNDNIWTDINDNNVVDKGEMGAFKIANSWSDGWGNSGFMWVAYDALNEVSCVKDTTIEAKRQPVFGEMCSINVMDYGEDSQLYLKYTLNTSDRTQVKISIAAEKDGTPYTRQVYSNIFHGDKIAYDGSTEATDATMVALLSNVVEGIKSEDLGDYSLSVTFEDMKNDGNILTVKDAQIVDETAGKVYTVQNTYPITLDGDVQTVKFTESTLNHAVVYYRGYDNPKINYKVDGSDYVTADLIPSTERRGYVHKYIIDLEDSDSATLYFTDENGNSDDNAGKLFAAKKGINYYVTENVAQPITGVITSDIDSVCDVDFGCDFQITASGGYAPYLYQYTFTNLTTNEKTVENYSDKADKIFYFRQEGEYEVAVEVKDFSDNVAVIKSIVQVKNIPFSFKEMYTEKKLNLVGDTVVINAISQNEKIRYTGFPHNKYDFTIKDEQGSICHTSTVSCSKYDLAKRYTHAIENFVPHKSGKYTATVSSTDANKEYAQMSITFDVFDKMYGDSNSDGEISILDATTIQLYLAEIYTDERINKELSDCDLSENIDILDATLVQCYLASLGSTGEVGKIIEYIPPVKPTEAPTQTPTEAPTQVPTDPPVVNNKVTFTNSFRWGGNISCYYWSDANTAMTSWPGAQMTNIGVNEYGETMYTFTVPQGATYIIFTNGSAQTTDISYSGGEIRYYPVSDTDSKGHNLVKTW